MNLRRHYRQCTPMDIWMGWGVAWLDQLGKAASLTRTAGHVFTPFFTPTTLPAEKTEPAVK